MTNENTFDPPVTLPLSELIELTLGDYHSVPVPKHIADTLLAFTKNRQEFGIFIEEKDEFSEHLSKPRLWRYSAWKAQCDSYNRNKAIAEKNREERYILDANIVMVSKAVERVLLITGDHSRIMARAMIMKKQRMKLLAVGVQRLYKSIEEIPG